MTPLSSPSVTMSIASLVTAINVLIAGGFSIAGLMSPKSILPASSAPTDASFIFAMYAVARTIPLALMALIAIHKHSEPALLILGTLAGGSAPIDAPSAFPTVTTVTSFADVETRRQPERRRAKR